LQLKDISAMCVMWTFQMIRNNTRWERKYRKVQENAGQAIVIQLIYNC